MAPTPRRVHATTAASLDTGHANAQTPRASPRAAEEVEEEAVARTTVRKELPSPGDRLHQALEILKPSLSMGRSSTGVLPASVGRRLIQRKRTLEQRRTSLPMDPPAAPMPTMLLWSTILRFEQLRQLWFQDCLMLSSP